MKKRGAWQRSHSQSPGPTFTSPAYTEQAKPAQPSHPPQPRILFPRQQLAKASQASQPPPQVQPPSRQASPQQAPPATGSVAFSE
eukprot:3473174-Pleurochrysis_carterae.AAC.5